MNGCGRYQCGGEYSVYFEMEMEGGGGINKSFTNYKWAIIEKTILWPLFMDGVQLPQG